MTNDFMAIHTVTNFQDILNFKVYFLVAFKTMTVSQEVCFQINVTSLGLHLAPISNTKTSFITFYGLIWSLKNIVTHTTHIQEMGKYAKLGSDDNDKNIHKPLSDHTWFLV